MTRVAVVVNPASGGTEDARAAALETLRSVGEVVPIHSDSLETFDDAVRSATDDVELVVVVGGDGTLNCTINALADRLDDLVFALVPMGTGNDLARTLGLMDDPPEEVARGIASWPEIELDVGRARGRDVERLFVNACMGGFPVQVDTAIEGMVKDRLGPLAFWVGGALAALDLERSRVTVNGREVEDCVAVGVGNGRTAGGGIEVWPSADPSDGALDVVVLPVANIVDAAKLVTKVRGGDHVELPEVRSWRGAEIEVAADPPMGFNVDGELVGLETPVRFEVAGRIRFRGPRR